MIGLIKCNEKNCTNKGVSTRELAGCINGRDVVLLCEEHAVYFDKMMNEQLNLSTVEAK